MSTGTAGPQPQEAREPGELERLTSRLGEQRDQLNAIVERAERIANELFGEAPPSAKQPKQTGEGGGGLLRTLSRVLDQTSDVLLSLNEVIERMEKVV